MVIVGGLYCLVVKKLFEGSSIIRPIVLHLLASQFASTHHIVRGFKFDASTLKLHETELISRLHASEHFGRRWGTIAST